MASMRYFHRIIVIIMTIYLLTCCNKEIITGNKEEELFGKPVVRREAGFKSHY